MKIELEKIVCPVDFSMYANHALEYAIAFAQKYSAQLKLVHVMETVSVTFAYSEIDVIDPSLHERLREDYENRLAELAAQTRERHEPVIPEMRFGKPFSEIIAAAKEWDADLIVMATHGRTGLEHALIGSVAEKVVRKAPCPVLTIRHPEHNFVHP